MDISIQEQDGVSVARISGAIDGKTAPEAQTRLTPLLQPGGRVILDMSQVNYMSSAGLRVLLLIYRRSSAENARLALVGLSEEVKDVMNVTGFAKFFTCCDSLEAALQQVK